MKYGSFAFVVGVVSFCCTLAPAADIPDTLTFKDLAGHPERWPATTTMTANARNREGAVVKGQNVRVLQVDEKGIFVGSADGLVIGVYQNDCDVVDAANETWSKLTPAQRAVDAASVMNDASLWPETVTSKTPIKVVGPLGLSKIFPSGTPMTLAFCDKGGVYVQSIGIESNFKLKFWGTDLIDGARQRALIDPDKRRSRLIEGVRKIMVDGSGEPFTSPSLDETKVFIFYFGANWCSWCHQLSPLLVKFVNENAAANPHMTVIMLNGDKNDADMLAYVKDENMPWPTVRMDDWTKVPVFAALRRDSFPQLLITDRYGKVICNAVGGGPDDVRKDIEELKKLNDCGAAR